MEQHTPDLSVVVAAKNVRQTLLACLKLLMRQAEGRNVEIIVVDASTDGSAQSVSEYSSQIKLLHANPEWLVPRLWSLGIEEATAPIVAITIGQCLPDRHWIDTILRMAAEEERCAGFGGSIDGPRDGRWRDWAMYFSRYSAYMPPLATQLTEEIAGDNAAYRKSALEGCEEVRTGFWENLIHHHLRTGGWTLMLSSDMRVQLGPCPSAWRFCRERYLHGRHFGSTRPGNSGPARWGRIVTAPALVPFLVVRIGSRIATHRRDWLRRCLLALPWLVVFMAAWSLGEAAGYLKPQPETR